MREKFEINNKLFYRFVEFTSKMMKVDLTHETFKLICLNKYTAKTKFEIGVKRLADAFMYCINNTCSDVTMEFVETVYFILSGEKMSKSKSLTILKKYYEEYDGNPQYKASCMFLEVFEMKLIKSVELAFLLAGFILMKSGLYPIIIYPNDVTVYKNVIKERKTNPNQFYLFLVENEYFIRKTHSYKVIEKEMQKTKNEVIKILKNDENNLRTRFQIERLYLYGSYAKESNIQTSDIDLLVVLDKSIINYEKFECMKAIKNYLQEILGESVDVMEFNHALTELEIHEMTKIITII